jgi:hypothetical protein
MDDRPCAACGADPQRLQAPAAVAPREGEPFLVVDGTLAVLVASREAERVLGAGGERTVQGARVTAFLVPAEAEVPVDRSLATLITWAIRGDAPPRTVVVRPAGTFGVRYQAKVGPCTTPRGAVIVLTEAH